LKQQAREIMLILDGVLERKYKGIQKSGQFLVDQLAGEGLQNFRK